MLKREEWASLSHRGSPPSQVLNALSPPFCRYRIERRASWTWQTARAAWARLGSVPSVCMRALLLSSLSTPSQRFTVL